MFTEDDFTFMWVTSWNMSTYHDTVLRDYDRGVQIETVTPKRNGGLGKPDTSYYIDNDDRDFKTLEEMIEAYNQKFNDEEDNPKQVVSFVKCIKDRATGKIIRIDINPTHH